MLDLAQLVMDAERLATAARNARCCDALRPCYRCVVLRRHVVARRLVIAFPRRLVRRLRSTCLVPVAGSVDVAA